MVALPVHPSPGEWPLNRDGLLDYVVSPQPQRLRDRETERLGGFQIDIRLIPGGLLDREFSEFFWSSSLQNLVGVGCGLSRHLQEVRPEAEQTSCCHSLLEPMH